MKSVLTFILFNCCLCAIAQVDINAPDFVYVQQFNLLASAGNNNTWTNNTTIAGWYATSEDDGDYTKYKAGSGSDKNSGLYSFGTDASDRSLGSLNQDNSGDIAYGVLFQNNSGNTIHSITLSYIAEQWRRTLTEKKGYQRTKLSYQIANAIDVSSSGLLNNANFIDLPEGYLITLDTTTMDPSEALNGNDMPNRANISIQFPITLLNNQELFIRFYDENAMNVDMALAVDDFQAEFSVNTVEEVSAVTDYSVAAFLQAGIIEDIPSEKNGTSYTATNPGARTDFENIFDYFYQGDYSNARLLAVNYDYFITSYSTNGSLYYVLRKSNFSTYYWGTYVTNTSPVKSCVTIQSPHPLKDQYTGNQAAVVFDLLSASNFMVAGTNRCNSAQNLNCYGKTSVCLVGDEKENYRISDLAHNKSSVFHIASVTLSNIETNMSFVQLHGFLKEDSDPHFIFSNGTEETPNVDNLATLQTEFQSTFPLLEVNVVHINGAPKLKAKGNVFGRYLNNYQSDICASTLDPTVASGKFLHLEQYNGFRKDVTLYDDLATMLDASIDCGVVLPVKLVSFNVRKNKSGGIYLEWKVVWENDTDYYEIQRSTDGVAFEAIVRIESLNILETHVYEYTDYQSLEGTNYYRIKQVDLDGNYSFSPIRMIKNIPGVSLFPNPATDVLYINGYALGQEVKVTSSDGVEVMDRIRRIGDRKGIGLTNYKDGLLILEIGGRQFKIVKIHN